MSKGVVAGALVLLAAFPAVAAAPRSPKGAWGTDGPGTGDRLGFKLTGTYKRDGRATGLVLKDLYISTTVTCEKRDEPGETESVKDHLAFPGTDGLKLVYNARDKLFEAVANRVTPVHGHTGSAPFGSVNYGKGQVRVAIVLGTDGRTGAARATFTAEGGAPPLGTLAGSETRGPCSNTGTLRASLVRGRYFR